MEKLPEDSDGAILRRLPVLAYFSYKHLPQPLQDVSMPLCVLAWEMARRLPSGPELAAGLRKLLEAKDCFVRAFLPRA